MGLADSLGGLGDKAKDLAGDNADKVQDGVEKGGDFVVDKTGGKYADKVDQGQEFAKERFGGEGGDQDGQGDGA